MVNPRPVPVSQVAPAPAPGPAPKTTLSLTSLTHLTHLTTSMGATPTAAKGKKGAAAAGTKASGGSAPGSAEAAGAQSGAGSALDVRHMLLLGGFALVVCICMVVRRSRAAEMEFASAGEGTALLRKNRSQVSP